MFQRIPPTFINLALIRLIPETCPVPSAPTVMCTEQETTERGHSQDFSANFFVIVVKFIDERNIHLLFHSFMHPLVASCLHPPDGTSHPQPRCVTQCSITNWAAQPGPQDFSPGPFLGLLGTETSFQSHSSALYTSCPNKSTSFTLYYLTRQTSNIYLTRLSLGNPFYFYPRDKTLIRGP